MKTRPLELNEYIEVIKLIQNGFSYSEKIFRSNPKIALALQLQASLGLRIGDVLNLKVNNFKNGKLVTMEEKTRKLQYRDINRDVYDCVKDFAIEQGLSASDELFSITVRNVQSQLKIVCDYLGLSNISTHSFRKMFATKAYESSNNDLVLVKELLNHSSVGTTQKYVRLSQQAINDASAGMNFIVKADENIKLRLFV